MLPPLNKSAITPGDTYFICVDTDKGWRIVESASSPSKATRNLITLVQHERSNKRDTVYRIFWEKNYKE